MQPEPAHESPLASATGTSPSDWITTEQLLAHAQIAGHSITRPQLKRASRAGLLVGGVQKHVTGERGSVTLWPASAAAQLVAVAELAVSTRSLDAQLLSLWWDGWQVADEALLDLLAKKIEGHALLAVDRSAPEEDRLDEVDHLVRDLDLGRVRGPVSQAMRRVGRSADDRRSLVWAFAAIASGVRLHLEAVDVGLEEQSLGDLLVRGFGLDLLADELTAVDVDTEASALAEDVVDVADVLDGMVAHAMSVIGRADLLELEAARASARLLLGLADLATSALLVNPKSGLGAVGELLDPKDPDARVLTLVLTLWFRREAPESVKEVTTALDAAVPKAIAFEKVLDNVPGLRELVVEAGGDQNKLASLAAEAPGMRLAINSYLAGHPDIAGLLDAV